MDRFFLGGGEINGGRFLPSPHKRAKIGNCGAFSVIGPQDDIFQLILGKEGGVIRISFIFLLDDDPDGLNLILS